MELEGWVGSDARGGSRDLFYRNDDLLAGAVLGLGGLQGTPTTFKGLAFGRHTRALQRLKADVRTMRLARLKPCPDTKRLSASLLPRNALVEPEVRPQSTDRR